ncbi:MAG: hypothetical protein HZA89_00160 [Verrucomicrobia bacterium]|nr:hypothetical protein [Verrucomicrobiota bacterium]
MKLTVFRVFLVIIGTLHSAQWIVASFVMAARGQQLQTGGWFLLTTQLLLPVAIVGLWNLRLWGITLLFGSTAIVYGSYMFKLMNSTKPEFAVATDILVVLLGMLIAFWSNTLLTVQTAYLLWAKKRFQLKAKK